MNKRILILLTLFLLFGTWTSQAQHAEEEPAEVEEKSRFFDWKAIHEDERITYDDWLKENYGIIPTKEIAEELGVAPHSIHIRARKIGIAKKQFDWKLMHGDSGFTHEEWLKENYGKMTAGVLAQRLGITKYAVQNKVRSLEIEKEQSWDVIYDYTGITREEWLIRHYQKTSNKELAQELGISIVNLKKKAQRLGLSKIFSWTDVYEDTGLTCEDWLKENLDVPLKELSMLLGVSPWVILGKISSIKRQMYKDEIAKEILSLKEQGYTDEDILRIVDREEAKSPHWSRQAAIIRSQLEKLKIRAKKAKELSIRKK